MRWTEERIVAALHEYASLTGKPPGALDWDPSRLQQFGRHDDVWFFDEHDWPTSGTVIRAFGSWSAGVRAAFPDYVPVMGPPRGRRRSGGPR